jgi:hypothetical protein
MTAALRLRIGNKPGFSLRVKAPVLNILGGQGRILDVEVPEFKKVAVYFSFPSGERMFVLEPGPPARFGNNVFYVEGSFSVIEKINNARTANDAFSQFVPE